MIHQEDYPEEPVGDFIPGITSVPLKLGCVKN